MRVAVSHYGVMGQNGGGSLLCRSLIGAEGFIDEPDCDCDARNNFGNDGNAAHANSAPGASGSEDLNRVPPFQYCYNCAPFHSNGRGPTLVPSPPSPAATPTSPRPQARAPSSEGEAETGAADRGTPEASDASAAMAGGGQADFTIYDLDSRSTTENRSPSVLSRCSSPLKRRRRVSVSEDGAGEDDGDDVECKRRRDSDAATADEAVTTAVEAPSCSSPDTSLNESGFESSPSSPDQQVRVLVYSCAWS